MVKPLVSFGIAALLVLVGGAAGCTKACESKAVSLELKKPEQAGVAATEPSMPADLAPSHRSMTTLGSSIFHQLDVEKKSRPQVALSAERVTEAFEKKGIEVQPLKQGLGGPIKAGYCAMSRTKKGVGLTVCEYPSVEAARAGKELSENRYGGGLGRRLLLNGETLLIVRAGTEEGAAEAQTMAAIFTGLR